MLNFTEIWTKILFWEEKKRRYYFSWLAYEIIGVISKTNHFENIFMCALHVKFNEMDIIILADGEKL